MVHSLSRKIKNNTPWIIVTLIQKLLFLSEFKQPVALILILLTIFFFFL